MAGDDCKCDSDRRQRVTDYRAQPRGRLNSLRGIRTDKRPGSEPPCRPTKVEGIEPSGPQSPLSRDTNQHVNRQRRPTGIRANVPSPYGRGDRSRQVHNPHCRGIRIEIEGYELTNDRDKCQRAVPPRSKEIEAAGPISPVSRDTN